MFNVFGVVFALVFIYAAGFAVLVVTKKLWKYYFPNG